MDAVNPVYTILTPVQWTFRYSEFLGRIHFNVAFVLLTSHVALTKQVKSDQKFDVINFR